LPNRHSRTFSLAAGNFTPQQPVGSNFSGLQARAPVVEDLVPNLLFFPPVSSNQMLTIAVAPSRRILAGWSTAAWRERPAAVFTN